MVWFGPVDSGKARHRRAPELPYGPTPSCPSQAEQERQAERSCHRSFLESWSSHTPHQNCEEAESRSGETQRWARHAPRKEGPGAARCEEARRLEERGGVLGGVRIAGTTRETPAPSHGTPLRRAWSTHAGNAARTGTLQGKTLVQGGDRRPLTIVIKIEVNEKTEL